MCCSVLQNVECVATILMGFNGGSWKNCWCCVAMCCNVLPCDALCCSVLHCHFECVAVLLVGLSRQAESGKNSS